MQFTEEWLRIARAHFQQGFTCLFCSTARFVRKEKKRTKKRSCCHIYLPQFHIPHPTHYVLVLGHVGATTACFLFFCSMLAEDAINAAVKDFKSKRDKVGGGDASWESSCAPRCAILHCSFDKSGRKQERLVSVFVRCAVIVSCNIYWINYCKFEMCQNSICFVVVASLYFIIFLFQRYSEFR